MRTDQPLADLHRRLGVQPVVDPDDDEDPESGDGGSVPDWVPAGPAPASSSAPRPVGPVDLNAATVEQFDALPGVGPVMAAAIVAWRQANGKFTSVDQLGEVDGIGPARLERLRPLVRV